MFEHDDALAGLRANVPLDDKIEIVHRAMRARFPFIARIAVTAFDPSSELLKTFIHSSDGDVPLVRYEASLAEAPSLAEILRAGRPRVVNDLAIFSGGTHEHTQAIRDQGYRSSYTMPMNMNGAFWGFLFFNSYERDVFAPAVLDQLDVAGHLITAVVVAEITAIRTLAAAVKTAHDMVHLRDPETGAHLDRMAQFSRLIARQLADDGRHRLSDRFIEQVYLFAPLHDLGKIGIPDRVLLKPDTLGAAEREEMKAHSLKGLQMIDEIAKNFGLQAFQGIDLLRNIALCHHEALDGSGYPRGLKGDEIPIEARIVAVADVFDALTSRRPYKEPWTNEAAFGMLQRLSKDKLDRDCVEALIENRSKVEEVQARFAGRA